MCMTLPRGTQKAAEYTELFMCQQQLRSLHAAWYCGCIAIQHMMDTLQDLPESSATCHFIAIVKPEYVDDNALPLLYVKRLCVMNVKDG